jgi:hypothetical protein
MTVSKLLSGRDMPLSNLEMTLLHTYQMAKARLEKESKRGKKR